MDPMVGDGSIRKFIPISPSYRTDGIRIISDASPTERRIHFSFWQNLSENRVHFRKKLVGAYGWNIGGPDMVNAEAPIVESTSTSLVFRKSPAND
jgi:hypothetical protein